MAYNIYQKQQLYCDIGTAWSFFSSANNLSKITPKEMDFTVLTELEDTNIYKGMFIDYRIRPLFGIPLRWQTEIVQVDFQHSFTDVQRRGPYKSWKHQHRFESNEEGVLMEDIVDYELPFGLLGNFAHSILVKKKLQNIFEYRHNVLEELFNKEMRER